MSISKERVPDWNMNKVDYKEQFKQLYNAPAKAPVLVEVPKMNFIKVDGRGTPLDEEFQQGAQALYPVAYTLKFMIRETMGIDYGVLPMEVIWSVNREVKGDFSWTMMLMQPELVTEALYEDALAAVIKKQNPSMIDKVKFESLSEGTCVQMLHKGAYDRMNDTLEIMLSFVKKQGYSSHRETHDIYLNDVRKTKPENLKTIMRLPVFK